MFQTIESFLLRKPVIFQILRFAGIGALNTALDFLILNLVTTTLGIESGPLLAVLNVVGVVAAIVQSYIWNKYWAFAVHTNSSLVGQFMGAVLVGGLGFVAFCLAVLPSVSPLLRTYGIDVGVLSGTSAYYWSVVSGFVLLQLILAVNVGFTRSNTSTAAEGLSQFGRFIGVSIIGVALNSVVLYVLATLLVWLLPAFPPALAKNAAKFAGVFVSLVWNFTGYKFFVFKR